MNKTCTNTKMFFTPREVAEALQLNVLTIYKYIREDGLIAIKFGRNLRIDKRDLDRFIIERKTKK